MLIPNKFAIATIIAGFLAGPALADGISNPGGSSSITSGATPITCTSGTQGVLFQSSGTVTCVSAFSFDGTTVLTVPAITMTAGSPLRLGASTGRLSSNSDSDFTFANSGLSATVHLVVDANLIGAFAQTTNPTSFRVYNTTSSANANYERAVLGWNDASNILTFGTQNAGTGSARGLQIVTSGTNAITISSAQLVALPAVTTDATHTDATICEDTTTHALYSGSGTLGICLGTSGRQFKTGLTPMTAGLSDIMRLQLHNYRYLPGYGDGGDRIQYGLVAQDVEDVLPDLARHDADGNTINYDSGAVLMIAIRAIQELKNDNDGLRAEIDDVRRSVGR